VTRECLSRGWKVYGIDKGTYAANISFLDDFLRNDNFTFLKKDISLLNHIPDCDYVINVAAESHVGSSIINSSDFMQSNINGVRNLLDLIRQKPDNVDNKPVFFHFSTDEVYGDIESGEHFETDILKPSNPYSASKAAADMLVLAWARTYGINYVILRPTNNYGIGQYPEKLIPLAVKLLMRGKQVRLHNAGTPIRNWLHSADTATAVTTIIDSGQVNEVYNVAGGFEQPNLMTVEKIINCYLGDGANWKDHVDLSYVREGQDVRYALNDDKLRALGWTPEKNFNLEIQNIVDYYVNNFKW
jgi:dTDP-glucose 4,6-dehydratase